MLSASQMYSQDWSFLLYLINECEKYQLNLFKRASVNNSNVTDIFSVPNVSFVFISN